MRSLVIALVITILIIALWNGFLGYAIAAILLGSLYFLIPPKLIIGGNGALRAYDEAAEGYKKESVARFYFNTNVWSGEFHEVKGSGDTRLPWLKVPDDSHEGGYVYLDLDGYNPDMKIAFEYQGIGHYEPPKDANNWKLKRWVVQRYNDMQKARLCMANGVPLIIIDYQVQNLEDYIKSRLRDLKALRADELKNYIPKKEEPRVKFIDKISKITRVERHGEGAPHIWYSDNGEEKVLTFA